MGHNPHNYRQLDFKLFEDGALGSETQIAAVNTNATVDADQVFTIGMTLEQSVTNDFGYDIDIQLQYQNVTKSTGWQNVNATSSHVRSTDGTPTNDASLGSAGSPISNTIYTGSFGSSNYVQGKYDDDNGLLGSNAAVDTGDWTEFRWGISLRSAEADDGDEIQLRMIFGSSDPERPNETLASYVNTVTITVNVPAGGETMVANTGSYTLTGSAMLPKLSLSCNTGAYTKTGLAMNPAISLACNTGAYIKTGSAMLQQYALIHDTGAYVITGSEAALVKSFLLTCDTGAYVVTGEAISLAISELVNTGAYTITGAVAFLTHGLVPLLVETGVYNLTGEQISLDLSLFCSTGGYNITGAALLTKIAMPVNTGGYVITGDNMNVLLSMLAEPGAYGISGSDVNGLISLLVETGNYILTGEAADLLNGYVLQAETGAYTITGEQISALISLLHNTGSYTLTGEAADLIFTPAPSFAPEYPRAYFNELLKRSARLRRR